MYTLAAPWMHDCDVATCPVYKCNRPCAHIGIAIRSSRGHQTRTWSVKSAASWQARRLYTAYHGVLGLATSNVSRAEELLTRTGDISQHGHGLMQCSFAHALNFLGAVPHADLTPTRPHKAKLSPPPLGQWYPEAGKLTERTRNLYQMSTTLS